MERGRILAASPTVGKSTLQSSEKGNTVRVVDTDDIIREHFPSWFDASLYKGVGIPQGVIKSLAASRDKLVAAAILLGAKPNDIFLTNLWSEEFIDHLLGPNEKLELYVGRISGKRITELSNGRGTSLSLGLTTKWVMSAKEKAHTRASNVIWLPDNLFLADVVKIVDGKYKLTDQGSSLLNKPFDDVVRINDDFPPKRDKVMNVDKALPYRKEGLWL